MLYAVAKVGGWGGDVGRAGQAVGGRGVGLAVGRGRAGWAHPGGGMARVVGGGVVVVVLGTVGVMVWAVPGLVGVEQGWG